MLISNLWVDTGLVNGVMGTFSIICYQTGGPPDLPLAVSYGYINKSSLVIFYRYHLEERGKLGGSETYAYSYIYRIITVV